MSVSYDPGQLTQLAQRLRAEEIEMVEFRATTANFSPVIIERDAAMRSGRLQHDGNPVREWCIGNVVGKPDRRGNFYPTKAGRSRRSTRRSRSSWRSGGRWLSRWGRGASSSSRFGIRCRMGGSGYATLDGPAMASALGSYRWPRHTACKAGRVRPPTRRPAAAKGPRNAGIHAPAASVQIRRAAGDDARSAGHRAMSNPCRERATRPPLQSRGRSAPRNARPNAAAACGEPACNW
jgi:hypothetical protein